MALILLAFLRAAEATVVEYNLDWLHAEGANRLRDFLEHNYRSPGKEIVISEFTLENLDLNKITLDRPHELR